MTIPDYELLQHCGHGAYGEVWLARSRSGQLVALKLMEREIGMEKELAGLVNYAKLKDSPHLIRIFHTGETADGLYYTMELADNLGTADRYVPATLANTLRQRKQLSPQETTVLGIQLIDGLKTLHDAGLVHRDVKPENILYVDGIPKLSDIGLVRRVSQTLSLGGTLGFLPPERLHSGSSSGKSNADDLYALGKVLYCCVTGNPVDEFPSFPPELIRDKECRKLNTVILTACDRNPIRRFHNASKFFQALSNGVSTGKRIGSVLHKLRFLLALGMLLLLCSIWFYTNRTRTPIPAAFIQSKAVSAISRDDLDFTVYGNGVPLQHVTNIPSSKPIMELTEARLKYLYRSHTAGAMAQVFGTDVKTVNVALNSYDLWAAQMTPGNGRQPRSRLTAREIEKLRKKLRELH